MDASSSPQESRRAFFDRIASRREKDIRRHRVLYDDRLRWLTSLMRSDASVIELGCGIAPTLSQLPQSDRTGVDFSPAMIDIAKQRDPQGTYRVADIEELEDDRTYDYVLLLDTVNYVNDVQQVLLRVRSTLSHERTRLVVTYYNFLWQPLLLLAQAVGWRRRFPEQNWLHRDDLRNLLELTGFALVQEEQRVLCPLRIPIVAHVCNVYLARLPLLRSLCMIRTMVARPVPSARQEYRVTLLSAVRNEKGNIERIASSVPKMGTETEVLFIEGHSTDGTWEEIERISREYTGDVSVRGVRQTGTGKADALHCGARESHGEIIIIYDGDFTVHPSELPKLYDVLAAGRAEFVNGSRLVYPLQKGAMRMLNLWGNKLFSLLFSWLFSQKLIDTLSPVKALFRRDYLHMSSRMDPFGDFDFFLGASMQQLHMREVPLHYLPRSYGTTKIRRFRHGWLLFRMFLHGAKLLKWR